MSRLRFSISNDGVRRATVQVNFRIDRAALVFAAAELIMEDEKPNRVAIRDHLRSQLHQGGVGWLHFGPERHDQGELEDAMGVADELVSKLWPGAPR